MATLQHCDFDDENCCIVCKQKNSNGVYYRSVEGTTYCPRHGGDGVAEKNKRDKADLYRTQVWKARIRHFTDTDGVKSLRTEVAILRVLLDEMLDQCQDRNALLMFSSKIANLAQEIGKLIVSCDRLEKNMGQMMDKPTAIRYAAKIIEILERHVTDPEALDNISIEILDELR